jgi:hypothetical protein
VNVITISIATKKPKPNAIANVELLLKKKGNMKTKDPPLSRRELASINSPAMMTAKPIATSG